MRPASRFRISDCAFQWADVWRIGEIAGFLRIGFCGLLSGLSLAVVPLAR